MIWPGNTKTVKSSILQTRSFKFESSRKGGNTRLFFNALS